MYPLSLRGGLNFGGGTAQPATVDKSHEKAVLGSVKGSCENMLVPVHCYGLRVTLLALFTRPTVRGRTVHRTGEVLGSRLLTARGCPDCGGGIRGIGRPCPSKSHVKYRALWCPPGSPFLAVCHLDTLAQICKDTRRPCWARPHLHCPAVPGPTPVLPPGTLPQW